MSAAITSRKMVMATWMPWTVVSRSWAMSVIITFMFEPAKLQMNCASARGISTRRRAADGRPAVSGSVIVPGGVGRCHQQGGTDQEPAEGEHLDPEHEREHEHRGGGPTEGEQSDDDVHRAGQGQPAP